MPITGPFGSSAGAAAGVAGPGLARAVDSLGAFARAINGVGDAVAKVLGRLNALTAALGKVGRAGGGGRTDFGRPVPAGGGGRTDFGRPVPAGGPGAGGVAGAVAGVLGKLGGALAGLAAAGGLAAGAMVGVGAAALSFVEKANPAAALMFTRVMDDLMAVLGQALTPILALVTDLLRTVADAFTLLVPIGAALAEAFRPLYVLLGEVLAGAIGYFAQVLKFVIPIINALVRVFVDLVRWVGRTIRELLALIGIDLGAPEEARKGASVGAAATSATIGSVESVLSKAMTSAFAVGTGAADPARQTAGAAADIKKKADEIYNWITKELPGILENLPVLMIDWLANLLPKFFKELAPAIAKEAKGGLTPEVGGAPVVAPDPILGGLMAGGHLLRWLDRQTS